MGSILRSRDFSCEKASWTHVPSNLLSFFWNLAVSVNKVLLVNLFINIITAALIGNDAMGYGSMMMKVKFGFHSLLIEVQHLNHEIG
jgi:hypothetical protein